MKICLKCGQPCAGQPILISDDDEAMDLEVYSDCCLEEFEEVDDDHIEDLIESRNWRESTDDLSDLDRLILKAAYEV